MHYAYSHSKEGERESSEGERKKKGRGISHDLFVVQRGERGKGGARPSLALSRKQRRVKGSDGPLSGEKSDLSPMSTEWERKKRSLISALPLLKKRGGERKGRDDV